MFGTWGYSAISSSLDPIPLRLSGAMAQMEAQRPSMAAGVPADQFTLFQLLDSAAQNPIGDLHSIVPSLKGSDEKPDVQVRVDLISFQISPEEGIEPDMQATMRLDMGKDRQSSAQQDALFWSIAAGLDLAAGAVSKDPKERSADLTQPFRNRPIEIPGALAELRVELVAHTPPPWWRRIFSFADNAAVKKLVSAVGFPGIALDAVKLLDEALGRFEEASAKPIFQSRPLTLALTERAATEFTGGLDTVKAAVLNPGLFVLMRHRDAPILRDVPPVFLGGYGRLVPKANWVDGALTLQDDDPYRALSYAVIKVKSREIALTSAF